MTEVTEIKGCTNCNTTHEINEMLYCPECSGHFCTQCWCDCIPFTAEELAEMEESAA